MASVGMTSINKTNINSLPLDCLCLIAALSLDAYRALLMVRRFALHTTKNHINIKYQDRFTICRPIHNKGQLCGYRWTLNGKEHRGNDLPAEITIINTFYRNMISIRWFMRGKLHRGGDKPAVYEDYSDNNSWWERILEVKNDSTFYDKLCADSGNVGAINRYWYRNDLLHRGKDMPAIVRMTLNCTNEWWLDGHRARNDGKPTVTDATGNQEWHVKGKLHSKGDKPATISSNGTKTWYREGLIHRDGDKPAVEYADGRQEWFIAGQLHRNGDKPAIIYADGERRWFKHGELHRDGGKPAVEYG
jgi:hypothetical protein